MGKIQFNSTNYKDLRIKLAKYKNARVEIDCAILEKTDRVNALRTLVNTDLNLVEKLENGEKIIDNRPMDKIKSDIDENLAKIDTENEALAEYKLAQKDRLDGAIALVTDALYRSYVDTINGDDNALLEGVEKWFMSFDATQKNIDDTVITVCNLLGGKCNSAKQHCKTDHLVGAMSKIAFKKLFISLLTDMLIKDNAISSTELSKWTYVLKDNR